MLVVLVLPTAWIRTREHPSVPVGVSLLSGLAEASSGLAVVTQQDQTAKTLPKRLPAYK